MMQRARKRSNKVALVLMVPATSLLMTACSDQSQDQPQTPAVVYTSVQECQQKYPDFAAQCEADYKQAVALHPQVAPKYQTQQECEADFGAQRCEVAPQRQYGGSGGGFFMPMMMGYMASQMFNRPQLMQPGAYSSAPGTQPRDNVRRDDQTSGFAGGGVSTQPLYKSRDDYSTFRTADNSPVANRTGAVSVRPQALALGSGSMRSSGGFGATAASHESSGG
jgi:uncharacterized protein YgiB involved in biofilm formation